MLNDPVRCNSVVCIHDNRPQFNFAMNVRRSQLPSLGSIAEAVESWLWVDEIHHVRLAVAADAMNRSVPSMPSSSR